MTRQEVYTFLDNRTASVEAIHPTFPTIPVDFDKDSEVLRQSITNVLESYHKFNLVKAYAGNVIRSDFLTELKNELAVMGVLTVKVLELL